MGSTTTGDTPRAAKFALILALVGWGILAANAVAIFSNPPASNSRLLSLLVIAIAIVSAEFAPLPSRNYVARTAMILAGTLLAANLLLPMLPTIMALHFGR
jgi:hypothetical protein